VPTSFSCKIFIWTNNTTVPFSSNKQKPHRILWQNEQRIKPSMHVLHKWLCLQTHDS
jgi:hypothetical protein